MSQSVLVIALLAVISMVIVWKIVQGQPPTPIYATWFSSTPPPPADFKPIVGLTKGVDAKPVTTVSDLTVDECVKQSNKSANAAWGSWTKSASGSNDDKGSCNIFVEPTGFVDQTYMDCVRATDQNKVLIFPSNRTPPKQTCPNDRFNQTLVDPSILNKLPLGGPLKRFPWVTVLIPKLMGLLNVPTVVLIHWVIWSQVQHGMAQIVFVENGITAIMAQVVGTLIPPPFLNMFGWVPTVLPCRQRPHQKLVRRADLVYVMKIANSRTTNANMVLHHTTVQRTSCQEGLVKIQHLGLSLM